MNPLTLKDAKIDGAKVKVGIVERSRFNKATKVDALLAFVPATVEA